MRLRDKGAKSVKELTENNLTETETDKQELLQNEMTYELLEEAMNELNEEQRICVNLFYLQKQSYQQITERTGYNLMQVKSYIQNGKRNLKIILEKRLKEKSQLRR